MKWHFIFVILFVVCFGNIKGQTPSYYIQLTDASGYLPSQDQLTDLKRYADTLAQVLPEPYRSDFRVYDFGFYVYQEYFNGGFPSVFQDKIDEVASLSPYYLLFGKQSDRSGTYTKFWIDIRLPDASDFECLTNAKVEATASIVNSELNGVHDANEKKPEKYHLAEIAAMNKLAYHVFKLIDCCQNNLKSFNECTPCLYKGDEMAAILSKRGMLEFQDATIGLQPNTNYQYLESEYEITVTSKGTTWQLTNELNQLLLELTGSGDASGRVYYFNDTINCEEFELYVEGSDPPQVSALKPNNQKNNDHSFQQEIVVLEYGGKRRLFFQFSNSNYTPNEIFFQWLEKWMIKTVSVGQRGGLLYLASGLMFEKCFGGFESWQDAWEASGEYGWTFFSNLWENTQKNAAVYPANSSPTIQISSYIASRLWFEIELDRVMTAAISGGITEQLLQYSGDIKNRAYQIASKYETIDYKDFNEPFMFCSSVYGEEIVAEEIVLSDEEEIETSASYGMLTPSGVAINLNPKRTRVAYSPSGYGYVEAFTLEDGRKYVRFWTSLIPSGNLQFQGYILESTYNELIKGDPTQMDKNWKRISADGGLFADFKYTEKDAPVIGRGFKPSSGGQLPLIPSCWCLIKWRNPGKGSKLKGKVNPPYIPYQKETTTYAECPLDCDDFLNALLPGVGANVYHDLKNDIDLNDPVKANALIELANYITTKTAGKTWGFFPAYLNTFSTQVPTDVINIFRSKKIYNLLKFISYYKEISTSRDAEVVFSRVDLDPQTGYNSDTKDYILNDGTPYEYSLADLAKRYEILSGFDEVGDQIPFSPQIKAYVLELESAGLATPLNQFDHTQQYEAQFGTNAAIFLWTKFFFTAVADVVEVAPAIALARYSSKIFSVADQSVKRGWIKKTKDFVKKIFGKGIDKVLDSIKSAKLKDFLKKVGNNDFTSLNKRLYVDVLEIRTPKLGAGGAKDWEIIAETVKNNSELRISAGSLVDESTHFIDQLDAFNPGDFIIRNADGQILRDVRMGILDDGTTAFKGKVDEFFDYVQRGPSEGGLGYGPEAFETLVEDVKLDPELYGLLYSDFSRVKGWEKLVDLPSLKINGEILDITKTWSDELTTSLKNAVGKNAEFVEELNDHPVVASYFEEGHSIISKRTSNLKEVELDMYAMDRSRPERTGGNSIFEPGNPTAYKSNTTKPKYDNLENNINPQSGKIKDNDGIIIHTDNVNGEGLMYAVDEFDNIFIGGRGGIANSFPHPTLIGGVNPNVKCAGMIKFNQGRILEVNNNSGHFKPSLANLEQIKSVFQNKFPANSFDSNFKFVNVVP